MLLVHGRGFIVVDFFHFFLFLVFVLFIVLRVFSNVVVWVVILVNESI